MNVDNYFKVTKLDTHEQPMTTKTDNSTRITFTTIVQQETKETITLDTAFSKQERVSKVCISQTKEESIEKSILEIAQNNHTLGLPYCFVMCEKDKVIKAIAAPLFAQDSNNKAISAFSLYQIPVGATKACLVCTNEQLKTDEANDFFQSYVNACDPHAKTESMGHDQYVVGKAYEKGNCLVKKDITTAKYWYSQGTLRNSYVSYLKLAELDPTNGRTYCKKAYALGTAALQEYRKTSDGGSPTPDEAQLIQHMATIATLLQAMKKQEGKALLQATKTQEDS